MYHFITRAGFQNPILFRDIPTYPDSDLSYERAF